MIFYIWRVYLLSGVAKAQSNPTMNSSPTKLCLQGLVMYQSVYGLTSAFRRLRR